MKNWFAIDGRDDILRKLKINVLDLDEDDNPMSTYYNEGVFLGHGGVSERCVLYLNYNEELFYRSSCDLNPEYFEYSKSKQITVERVEDRLHVNVVFLRSQETERRRYDASTQMLSWNDAAARYHDDYHPVAWVRNRSLEEKFLLTFLTR